MPETYAAGMGPPQADVPDSIGFRQQLPKGGAAREVAGFTGFLFTVGGAKNWPR